jgi:protein SCO1/2
MYKFYKAYFVGFIFLVISISISCRKPADFKGIKTPENTAAQNIQLTDQNGRQFKLTDYRGKVILIFFGFTHCPDVCPMTLHRFKKVDEELKINNRVKFVYITVDPERDTPERLKEYMETYGPNFIGLTGSKDALESIYTNYGVFTEKVEMPESALGYTINHTSRIFVIDREGYWRLLIPYDSAPEDILHDIRLLLN